LANGNAIAKPDISITVPGEGFAGLGEGGAVLAVRLPERAMGLPAWF